MPAVKRKAGIGFAISGILPFIAIAVWMLRPLDDASRWFSLCLYAGGWVAFVVAVRSHRLSLVRVEKGRRRLMAFFRARVVPIGVGVLLIASGWALAVLVPPGHAEIADVLPEDLPQRLDADLKRLEVSRRGLLGAIDSAHDLWARSDRVHDAEYREAVLSAWSTYLDHSIELDRLIDTHQFFYRINPISRLEQNARSFLIGYGALVAQLTGATRLLDAVGNRRDVETLLDDARPELGVAARAYHRIHLRLSEPNTALRFHAGRAHLAALELAGRFRNAPEQAVVRLIHRDYGLITRRFGTRSDLVIDNPLDALESTLSVAWYPLQKGIAETMSDIRTARRPSFITRDDLRKARTKLEPGDILVERRNWYLTNIGLPGFWPHAALYVGTPEELDAYFDRDSRDATNGKAPSDYLREAFPALHAEFGKRDEHGDPRRVLEAIGEGVSLTSFEHSGGADYLGAMRPRLDESKKLEALVRAFAFFGKPYDFDFDFITDRAIVCSELVYKAYRAGDAGLGFELSRTSGRWVLPPNDMVRKLDRELDQPGGELDFVLFLDGSEREGRAFDRDAAAFRASWRRPKWDIMQQ